MSFVDSSSNRGTLPDCAEVETLPYAAQLRRGFARLRFAPGIELEFREWYWRRGQMRLRIALSVAMGLFLMFAIKDAMTMPSAVAVWTAGIRLGPVNLALLAALLASRFLPRATAERWLLLGISVSLYGLAAAFFLSAQMAEPLPYEGLLIVTFYIYFMTGVRVPNAIAVCAPLILVFPFTAAMLEFASRGLWIQTFYLLTANGVGIVGAYVTEHYAREGFLSEKLARFRAERDPLTLLYNRGVAISHLRQVWRIGSRQKVTVSVLMIDVDNFKLYNDHYGHVAGDECLKLLAARLKSTFNRPLDLVARYGGEEFIAITYGLSPAETLAFGEHIRATVEQASIRHEHPEVRGHITISIGLATEVPAVESNSGLLIEKADKALYAAKAAGRNRVCPAATGTSGISLVRSTSENTGQAPTSRIQKK